jgi:hypothetical protein
MNQMTYPKAVTFNNGCVLFKLTTQVTSVELLEDDLAGIVKMDTFTFCIIRGYNDDHVRCIIYKGDNIAYDQQYCFPDSHAVLGNGCMDLACHTLAEMFFASFLAESM